MVPLATGGGCQRVRRLRADRHGGVTDGLLASVGGVASASASREGRPHEPDSMWVGSASVQRLGLAIETVLTREGPDLRVHRSEAGSSCRARLMLLELVSQRTRRPVPWNYGQENL